MFLPKEDLRPKGSSRSISRWSTFSRCNCSARPRWTTTTAPGPSRSRKPILSIWPSFVPNSSASLRSQDGTTRELLLWPPLRNIVYDEYGNLRLFWWSGAQPANETVLSVRRGLSSGRLPSSIVDTDGKIVAVPANFWNSDANHVSDVMQCGRLASFEGHAGPVILFADDLFNWLKATGELPSEGAELPSKVLTPMERARAYLVQEIRRSPEAPPTQTVGAMRAQCLKMFPGLSMRGFEFAYKFAKAQVPELNWSQRGPRKKFKAEFKTEKRDAANCQHPSQKAK